MKAFSSLMTRNLLWMLSSAEQCCWHACVLPAKWGPVRVPPRARVMDVGVYGLSIKSSSTSFQEEGQVYTVP